MLDDRLLGVVYLELGRPTEALAAAERALALAEGPRRIRIMVLKAQADGSLDRGLPSVVVLYTLYARACDPVLGFLKSTGQFDDEQIIDMVLRTCFQGLSAR